MTQHVRMGKEGKGGGLAACIEKEIDGRAVQGSALMAHKESLGGGFEAGALFEPSADGPEFVAAQGLRRG